jgi:hypothetical protein
MPSGKHAVVLVKGVEAWNRWRDLNPSIHPDLSGLDLFEANLNEANLALVDLSRTNLSGAELRDAILFRANLSGADLSMANLRGAKLLEANLSGANLTGARLLETDFSGADLSEVDLKHAQFSDYTVWPVDFDAKKHRMTHLDYTGEMQRAIRLSIDEDKSPGEVASEVRAMVKQFDAPFTIEFDPRVPPLKVKSVITALADFYRACGGVGFEVGFDLEEVLTMGPVHVRR